MASRRHRSRKSTRSHKKVSKSQVHSAAKRIVGRALKNMLSVKPMTKAIANSVRKEPGTTKKGSLAYSRRAVKSLVKSLKRSPAYKNYVAKAMATDYIKRKHIH